jgi:hypothetical protein
MLRGITAGYNQVIFPSNFLFHSPQSGPLFQNKSGESNFPRRLHTPHPQFFNASGLPPMTFTRILIANWDSDISGVTAHLYPHTRCSTLPPFHSSTMFPNQNRNPVANARY